MSSGVDLKYVRESKIGICGLKKDEAVVRRIYLNSFLKKFFEVPRGMK